MRSKNIINIRKKFIRTLLSSYVVALLLLAGFVGLFSITEGSGGTPGNNSWGDCNTEIYVGISYPDSALTIDTSGWSSTGTFYLYYPVYRNVVTTGVESASAFSWVGATARPS